MKTYVPKKENIEKKWWLLDAENQVLGRLATEVAVLLRGKRKPLYADFLDCGDHVIVINALVVTFDGGQKMQVRAFLKFIYDTTLGKSLVCNDDPFADVIVSDECRVGTGVYAVSRKHFGTNRLHQLNVIGIEYRNVLTALAPGFV